MEFKAGSISSVVLLAYDATKDHTDHELRLTINEIRMRGDILLGGDKLIVLGVLHSFPHPMGYQMEARADSLFGTNARAMEEEVQKKTDIYFKMLQESAEQCKDERVSVEVKIIAGDGERERRRLWLCGIDGGCGCMEAERQRSRREDWVGL
ncbi:hypothetical protein FRX31_020162 [Thalictrum thalictroides]|uniref:Uncharacterized protein n=1 Tax=Thalictrum thalictroides TaxID=46969 RepID=A0A7J6W0X4_THATH|nr:hypothetical protein FRX31_020162 [Thalictrum thalictroides]